MSRYSPESMKKRYCKKSNFNNKIFKAIDEWLYKMFTTLDYYFLKYQVIKSIKEAMRKNYYYTTYHVDGELDEYTMKAVAKVLNWLKSETYSVYTDRDLLSDELYIRIGW